MTELRSRRLISTPRRKFGVAAFLTLFFALLPFAVAGAAQAITIPAHGQVYNGDSPRCLDSGTANGALLFNCSTSTFQQWIYNRADEIVGNSPTGCLDESAANLSMRQAASASTLIWERSADRALSSKSGAAAVRRTRSGPSSSRRRPYLRRHHRLRTRNQIRAPAGDDNEVVTRYLTPTRPTCR